jgi:hypothetical protein
VHTAFEELNTKLLIIIHADVSERRIAPYRQYRFHTYLTHISEHCGSSGMHRTIPQNHGGTHAD